MAVKPPTPNNRPEPVPPRRRLFWQPFDCECCNNPFNQNTWTFDRSLSGELTWTCPKCHHPNFPSLE
jgi:hypothetical protein